MSLMPKFMPDPERCAMVLAEDFSVLLPVSQQTLRFKAGYSFNGFSSPRLTWTASGLYPFRPDLCRGGLAHDGLFQSQPPGWTPAMARAELLALLKQDGVCVLDREETEAGLLVGEDEAWAANSDPALLAAARQFVRIV